MIFNWTYFPLENNGESSGVEKPLPGFSTQYGNPWALNNGWFNGDGSSTSLITHWNESPALFEGVALPRNGSYMIGFQVDLGPAPTSSIQTIFSCGYNKDNITDGVKCLYTKLGEIIFLLKNRNYPTILKRAGTGDMSNQLLNVYCYIDHRPAGIGINSIFTHIYEDGTDTKYTSFKGGDLSVIGDIYPQEFTQATALVVGSDHNNGNPLTKTYFSGRIRRLHIMHFGYIADDEPGNIAELMNELSKANMVATPEIKQLMGFPVNTVARSFVRFS